MKTPRFIFILPIKTEYVGLCWGQQQSVQNARASVSSDGDFFWVAPKWDSSWPTKRVMLFKNSSVN